MAKNNGLATVGQIAFAIYRLANLRVWRVDKYHYACALAVASHDPAVDPMQVR